MGGRVAESLGRAGPGQNWPVAPGSRHKCGTSMAFPSQSVSRLSVTTTRGARHPWGWPLTEAWLESRSETEAEEGSLGIGAHSGHKDTVFSLCPRRGLAPHISPAVLLLWSLSWPHESRILQLDFQSPSSLGGEVNYFTQSPCYTQPRRFDDFPPLESVELKFISEPSSILHRLGNAGLRHPAPPPG